MAMDGHVEVQVQVHPLYWCMLGALPAQPPSDPGTSIPPVLVTQSTQLTQSTELTELTHAQSNKPAAAAVPVPVPGAGERRRNAPKKRRGAALASMANIQQMVGHHGNHVRRRALTLHACLTQKTDGALGERRLTRMHGLRRFLRILCAMFPAQMAGHIRSREVERMTRPQAERILEAVFEGGAPAFGYDPLQSPLHNVAHLVSAATAISYTIADAICHVEHKLGRKYRANMGAIAKATRAPALAAPELVEFPLRPGDERLRGSSASGFS